MNNKYDKKSNSKTKSTEKHKHDEKKSSDNKKFSIVFNTIKSTINFLVDGL